MTDARAWLENTINGLPPIHTAAVAAILFLALGTVFGSQVRDAWSTPSQLADVESRLDAHLRDTESLPERMSALEEKTDRSDSRWLHTVCRMDGETDNACERLLAPEDRVLLRSMRGQR